MHLIDGLFLFLISFIKKLCLYLLRIPQHFKGSFPLVPQALIIAIPFYRRLTTFFSANQQYFLRRRSHMGGNPLWMNVSL